VTTPKRARKSTAAKKRRKPAKKKPVRRRKLRTVTPGAAATPPEPAVTPEVGELRPGPRGGMILYGSVDGNPGNKGGGRLSLAVRQEIGRMVREHGLPFLERVLSGEECDVVPFKVKGPQTVELIEGKMVKLDGGERIDYARVPIAARTRLQGVAVGLSSSEGMVSPEKAGLQKRRILEVRFEEVRA
jgi:hypothetical protein